MTGRTIGAVAAAAGLSPKAVRLYETRGLLPPPARTPNGYRVYTDDDVTRLRFIAAARRLGLHLDQVGDVLTAARGGQRPCATTRTLLQRRIAEIDQLAGDLLRMRGSLTDALAADNTATDAQICPVIEAAPL